MILGREQLIVLERYAQQQVQIWDDSADFGIPNPTDEIKNALRPAIIGLQQIFKYETTFWGKNKSSRMVELFMPVERDEGGVSGYRIEISFDRQGYKKIGFGTIREVLSISVVREIRAGNIGDFFRN